MTCEICNPQWRFLALLNREGFGAGIKESPIVERDAAISLVTSLTTNF